MNRFTVIIIILLAIAVLLPTSTAQGSENSIKMDSDLQILEYPPVYGGHITWTISGEIAKELRNAIAEEYHVRGIDLIIASHYFKQKLEPVIEKNEFGCGYLSFVRLTRADPLHDDTNGILNDAGDVEGLIGDINSTSPITLKMLVRGEPMENENVIMVPHNLFYAPFLALVDNESQLYTKFPELKSVNLETQHYEVIGGLGNFENMPAGVTSYRFIVGEFFISNDPNHVMRYARFDPLESPLLLFILFIVTSYSFRKIENYWSSKYSDKVGPVQKKHVKYTILGTRIGLAALYFIYLFSGLIYVILLIASIAVIFLFIRWYYGRYEE